MSKIYYGPLNNYSNSYSLSPSPSISISTEFQYSNDMIIGYTYVVNLTGYVMNYKKTELEGPTNPDYGAQHIRKNMERADSLREILSHNGYNLTIFNVAENGTETKVLVGKGGILRSLSLDKTDDGWTRKIPYNATLEFVELEFLSENVTCNSPAFKYSVNNTNNLTYKIKSFNDDWSFDINDESFNFHDEYHNMVINVSYNVSAVGKNYVNDGTELLMPAHENARLFCQKMIYDRVSSMEAGLLFDVDDSECGSKNLDQIHAHASGGITYGLHSGNNKFDKYNESLRCDISESEGSFSASYSCILKSNAYNKKYSTGNVIHNVTKSIDETNESKDKTNKVINVEGNIQGLIRGGIIGTNNEGAFSLPRSGTFLISAGTPNNKIFNSKNFYSSIGSDDDLKKDFKEYLGISYEALGLELKECEELLNENLKPRSFNLTHDYNQGTISYSASYDAEVICSDIASSGSEIVSVSITRENPVPVLAEIIIPNNGVYIQDIGTKTNKKITINIEGNKKTEDGTQERLCCGNSGGLASYMSGLFQECSTDDLIAIPSGIPIPASGIILSKQKNINALDGSYNTSITYVCAEDCV